MYMFHVIGTVHKPGCTQLLESHSQVLAEILPIKQASHST